MTGPIHFDTISPVGLGSQRNLVEEYDPRAHNFRLKRELRDWLMARRHVFSHKLFSNGVYEFYVDFPDPSDALLFKLTWGGKCQRS